MAEQQVLTRAELAAGTKKTVSVGETKILVVHAGEGELYAVEAECPHAKAPLEQGAVCEGRLVCPWHMGTFELRTGAWVEPPPLRGLKTYGVRWEGDAVMVDPEPRNVPTMASAGSGMPVLVNGADRQVVTIGGGAAAAAAVCALRQGGFAGTVTVIDAVAGEPVDRTNLSKMTLAGKKPAETLPLWPADAVEALHVERVTAGVERLERPVRAGQRGAVLTNKGTRIEFDYALMATGGVPKRLGIAGEDGPRVHTIRHVADVEAIGATIGIRDPRAVRAVILGDSFIAFEAASALRTRGLPVTVVSRAKVPFAKKFGDKVAGTILGLHRKNGVALRLGVEASGITEEVVTLEGGEALPAELVIVAVGVAPATEFAHGMALERDGSVAVGRDLVAADRVWVAGDIATVDGVRIEHWRLAEQHGRTAGRAMLVAAGAPLRTEETRYDGVPFFWTAHFGKRFGYVGHAEEWDAIIVDGDVEEASFLAYYVKDETLKAVMGCGRDTAMAVLAERMRGGLELEAARGAVKGL